MSNKEPEGLAAILAHVEAAVRRAYADGYRQGAQETTDRMMRAATAGVDQRLPTILGETAYQVDNPSQPSGARMSPPRVGLAGAPRQYRYGAVISTIREGILASPETGMTVEDMVAYCRHRGLDVTPNAVRDTVKRLRGGEEIERHHGAYFPGRRLRNERPMNGEAESYGPDLLQE